MQSCKFSEHTDDRTRRDLMLIMIIQVAERFGLLACISAGQSRVASVRTTRLCATIPTRKP